MKKKGTSMAEAGGTLVRTMRAGKGGSAASAVQLPFPVAFAGTTSSPPRPTSNCMGDPPSSAQSGQSPRASGRAAPSIHPTRLSLSIFMVVRVRALVPPYLNHRHHRHFDTRSRELLRSARRRRGPRSFTRTTCTVIRPAPRLPAHDDRELAIAAASLPCSTCLIT